MNTILENQEIIKRPKHTLGRFLKRSRRYFLFLAIAVIAPGVIFLVILGIRKSPYFSIQKIEVVGELKQLSMDEIVKASRVGMGTNLFRISLEEVIQNVSKLPWVHSVSVRRQTPSTLWITVKEQKPTALLLAGPSTLPGVNKLYFVSEEGIVFKEVGPEFFKDLPVLTGFEREDSLKEVIALLHFLESNVHFEMFGLSEIHYNDAEGFSIVTLLGPMEVKLGRAQFAPKIERLSKVWWGLGEKLQRIRGIDLDYEDRAFVKL